MSVATMMRSAVAPIGDLGGILFPVGCLALLTVPGILFYQAREWLNTGSWPAVTVADGLAWAGLMPPPTAWGVELVTKQFLGFPLSIALLPAIGLPLFAYAGVSKWLEETCEPDVTPLN